MSRASRADKGYMRQTHLSRMRKSINQSQSSPTASHSRYIKSASPTSRNTFVTVQPKAQRTIDLFEQVCEPSYALLAAIPQQQKQRPKRYNLRAADSYQSQAQL